MASGIARVNTPVAIHGPIVWRSVTVNSLSLHTFMWKLDYRRQTAMQGGLVITKRGKLELVDNILRRL